ncbi:alpha/beta fold hydrolase [Stenomitos frigidus]|uniref:Alpha/beta hydrolase n=1 Tax=Stenomitos frigidus ULC18 TaxID=2107698 RepID=A0A2T1DSQ0_9CYAN|nr:alpha/beta hydrolase [Stenomitos frigidus]PSB23527.1 alpha/beta hydrolase [Stenomitos frigidus ULC18]
MQDWWQTTFPQGRQTLVIQDANDRPVSIAYGEKGVGKPLVLVHGVASWSYCWHANIDALAEHFRVLCFDAKGSGFSDKPLQPEQPNYKVIELERVIRALCDEPAVIVAESLGALAALAVVQAHPELCDRLVLLNVPIFPKQLPNWGMRLLADIPLSLVETVDQLRLAKLLEPIIRQIVYVLREEVVADPSHVTADDVYWSTYPQIEFPGTLTKLAAEFQLAAREIRLLEQGQPNLIHTVQQNLSKITCPTLILWADQDRWFPVSDGEKLRDRLTLAKLQIIPHCGHYAAGGQPQFVNTAILSFLAESTRLSWQN